MSAIPAVLLAAYAALLAVVCVYGLHRCWMVGLYLRTRGAAAPPHGRFADLPRVTVQLPMFNERHVARRAIEAACALEYPRGLLEVQVLDDSTDESAQIARSCCERLVAAGHDVRYLHRAERGGFKAGALADGLRRAAGEFIAVFDADFVPPADLLLQAIHHFTDPGLGMVQLRWSHLNRHDSPLTEIQAMYLDGHFVVEQSARARSGRWFNFNGTAGLWRRSCIEDAGGWQHDTLTEDTDLSYRAQLRGWRFLYLPAPACPAEIPPTMSAFLTQQHRWNKGLAQTAIKLLPAIMASEARLATKIEAWFHLTSPVIHLAIVGLAVLAAPLVLVPWRPAGFADPAPAALRLGTLLLVLGTLAACAFYVTAQRAQGRSAWRAMLRLPGVMVLGIGMSATNARAVVEALLRRRSPFVRTPKYAGAAESADDPLLRANRRMLPPRAAELALGLLTAAGLVMALVRPHAIVGAPFLAILACGYLGIGVPWLRRAWERRHGAMMSSSPRG